MWGVRAVVQCRIGVRNGPKRILSALGSGKKSKESRVKNLKRKKTANLATAPAKSREQRADQKTEQ